MWLCKIRQEQSIISSHDNKSIFTANKSFPSWKKDGGTVKQTRLRTAGVNILEKPLVKKKTTTTTTNIHRKIAKMSNEVVFGISRRKGIKKPQMSGQVTATSNTGQENGQKLEKNRWARHWRRAVSDTCKLQTADCSLTKSQLLKANRSKMGPETYKYYLSALFEMGA